MKEQLEAFLADLVAVCKKHNMGISETSIGAIHLYPWPEQTPTPGILVAEIGPAGSVYNDDDPEFWYYDGEGQI